MTIKPHEMILSRGRRLDARQKFSPGDFSFANSCRQIHIFCAKFIISLHLATMAIGSANPVFIHDKVKYLLERISWSIGIGFFLSMLATLIFAIRGSLPGEIILPLIPI